MPNEDLMTYEATTTIGLGDNGYTIQPGETVHFDGSRRAVIADQEYDLPNLSGCVERGWLVPKGQSNGPPQRQSANMKMRKPTPSGQDSVPSQDSRSGTRETVVSSVSTQQKQRSDQMSNRQNNPQQQPPRRSQQPQQQSRQNVQGGGKNVQQGRTQMTQTATGQGRVVGGGFQNPAYNDNQKVNRTSTRAKAPKSGARGRRGGQQQGQRQQGGRAQPQQPPQPQQQQQRTAQQQPQGQGRATGRQVQGGPSEMRAKGMTFQNENVSNRAARQGGATGVNQPAGGYSQLNQNVQPAQSQQAPPQQPHGQHQSQPQQNVQQAQQNADLNDVDFSGEEGGVVEQGGSVEPPEDVDIPDDYDLAEKQDRLEFVQQVFPELEWDLENQWKSKLKILNEDDQFEDPAKIRAVYAVESPAMKARIEDSFEDVFEDA